MLATSIGSTRVIFQRMCMIPKKCIRTFKCEPMLLFEIAREPVALPLTLTFFNGDTSGYIWAHMLPLGNPSLTFGQTNTPDVLFCYFSFLRIHLFCFPSYTHRTPRLFKLKQQHDLSSRLKPRPITDLINLHSPSTHVKPYRVNSVGLHEQPYTKFSNNYNTAWRQWWNIFWSSVVCIMDIVVSHALIHVRRQRAPDTVAGDHTKLDQHALIYHAPDGVVGIPLNMCP